MAGPSFIELPTDIHLAILTIVPWTDIILRVRRTSRALCDLTKSKALWTSLITHPTYIGLVSPRIEKPLHQYTGAELEAIYLRWKRTMVFWSRPGHFPDDLHTKLIHPTTSMNRFNRLILIPGGRWLIISTINGSVLYLDLTSPQPMRHVVLIPPQLLPGHRMSHNGTGISINVQSRFSHGEPLSFTLTHAVFFKDAHTMMDQELSISVWNIECALEEQGRRSTLIATRLFEVDPEDAPSPCYVHSIVATPDLVLYTLNNTSSESGKETYVARRRNEGSGMSSTSELVTLAPFDQYMLGRDPIISAIGSSHIITVNSPSETPTFSTCNTLSILSVGLAGQPALSMVHQLVDDVHLPFLWQLSGPFRINSTTRWVGITTSSTIIGIIVPDGALYSTESLPSQSNSEAAFPSAITLRLRKPNDPHLLPSDTMISFGYHHVSLSSLNQVDIISFAWPDDHHHIPLPTLKSFHFPTFSVETVIDEISGTLVRTNGKDLYISQTT